MIQAISGTRRSMREMADGTVRVQIDIDPRFRAQFFEMFGQIDMPIALAPLVADFETKEPEKPKGGPLAKLAGMWCSDQAFWGFIDSQRAGQFCYNATQAADWVRQVCQVESRAELDSVPYARQLFEEFVRGPYMKWRLQRGLHDSRS